MFFSRDNDPDLGDDCYGSSYGRTDEYTPSCTSLHSRTLSFTIPISYYLMSKEDLHSYFAKQLADYKFEQEQKRKQDKIKSLETELNKLKGDLNESQNCRL